MRTGHKCHSALELPEFVVCMYIPPYPPQEIKEHGPYIHNCNSGVHDADKLKILLYKTPNTLPMTVVLAMQQRSMGEHYVARSIVKINTR